MPSRGPASDPHVLMVPVPIPLVHYPAAAVLAEVYGHETVAAWLAAHVQDQVQLPPARFDVLVGVQAGKTDQQIAAHTGRLLQWVREVRRSYGLPANRPKTNREKAM